MDANPSKEWTDKERLQIILEHAAYPMNHNKLLRNPEAIAATLDVIMLIASSSPAFLEENRIGIMRLPTAH